MPSDDLPRKMISLSLELLGAPQQFSSHVQLAGAWKFVEHCVTGRPALGAVLLDSQVFDLMVTHLHSIGRSAELLVCWPPCLFYFLVYG